MANIAIFKQAIRTHLYVVIGCLLSGFLLGGAIASDPEGLFGQTVAAWVQAIASVIAIIAAIWVSQREANRVRRDQDRALVRSLAQVAGLATLIMTMVERHVDNGEGRNRSPQSRRAFEEAVVALERYPIEHIPTARAGIAAVSLASQARQFIAVHGHWRSKISIDEEGYVVEDVERWSDQSVTEQVRLGATLLDSSFKTLVREWRDAANGRPSEADEVEVGVQELKARNV